MCFKCNCGSGGSLIHPEILQRWLKCEIRRAAHSGIMRDDVSYNKKVEHKRSRWVKSNTSVVGGYIA